MPAATPNLKTSTRRLLAAAAFLALPVHALADDLEWVAPPDGINFWSDAGNWSPVAAPDATDNLFFNAGDLVERSVLISGTNLGNDLNVDGGFFNFAGPGATVDLSGDVRLGDADAADLASGAFLTIGNGLNLSSDGELVVGDAGFATMLLSSGTATRLVDASRIVIGDAAGGEAVLTAAGSGTVLQANTMQNLGIFSIGRNGGTGTLNLLDGAQARTLSTGPNDLVIGVGVGSVGTLNVNNSFVETEDLVVGEAGSGFMNVTNGGRVILTDGTSPEGIIADRAGGTGAAVVTDAGSEFTAWRVDVGRRGSGTLSVSNGGLVRARFDTNDADSFNGQLFVGAFEGSEGTVAVFDGGTLRADRTLFIGDEGDGELRIGRDLQGNVVDGGTVHAVDILIGDKSTGSGTFIVDGSEASVAATDDVRVGGFGTGRLEVLGGAGFEAAGVLSISGLSGGSGSALVSGTGSTVTAQSLFAGNNNNAPGQITEASLDVRDGGVATFNNNTGTSIILGDDTGGVATLNIDGAGSRVEGTGAGAEVWIGGSSTTGELGGTGTVNITDGGSFVSAGSVVLGYQVNAVGTVNVIGPDSSFDANGDTVLVGRSGTGDVNVSGGASFTAGGILLGANNGSDGSMTVTGSGSTADVEGFFILGDNGVGALSIEDGAVVTNNGGPFSFIIGDESSSDGSSLSVTGSGSTFEYLGTGRLIVGLRGGSNASPSTATISDGGTVATNARISLAEQDNSHATLIVDDGIVVGKEMLAAVDPGTVADVVVRNGGQILIDVFAEIAAENDGDGSLTVEGAGSLFRTGGDFSVAAANAANDGDLFVRNGGRVETGNLGFVGRFNNDVGEATIGGPGLPASWTVASTLFIGPDTDSGSGVLNILANGTVDTDGELRLQQGGTVNIDGGTLEVADLTLTGGTINFDQGTVRFSDPGVTLLTDLDLEAVLGEDRTLVAGQTLDIDGEYVPGSTVRINGGRLDVGRIAGTNIDLVDFDRGTFALTDQDLVIGTQGLFGPTVTFTQDQDLEVAQDLFVQPNAELTIVGGYAASRTVNSGSVTFISPSGQKQVDGLYETTGDTTVVGIVRFNELVSGPGDFFGPGVSVFVGGYQPGSSPGVIEFEGSVAFADTSVLEIELDGIALGEFDRLEVLGDVTFDGTLVVAVDQGFMPLPGDSFEFATFASSAGVFDDVIDSLGLPGLVFDVVYGATSASIEPARLLAGDANFDGIVNLADFGILRAGFGAGGRQAADFNLDGVVSLADFGILRASFGSSLNLLSGYGGSSSGVEALAVMDAWAATVPEPTLLAPIAASGLLLRRRRA